MSLCRSLPQEPGIYLFLDENKNIIYVGKAKNLKNRVSSYVGGQLGEKTKQLVSHIHSVKTILVESELESLLLEAEFIKKYNPKYNIQLTDNKSYQLIKVTPKALFPTVTLMRSHGNPEIYDHQSAYFGPFPSSKAIKSVLKTIRRIFPYQSVENHPKKPCLYHHLGLCPCLPAFNNEENRKEYKKTIRHIIQFLQGKKIEVLKDLEKERDAASKNEEFEKAKSVQQQIDAINYVTSPIKKPFEYEINPNLRADLRTDELSSLKEILNKHGVNVESLDRIECFDISNISGTNSVGSMVVLTNGERDSSQYRRFKTSKNIVGPNDFASMAEVLQRRIRHTEWPYPGLLIVDGGKGQISAAFKVLNDQGLNIPLVGLAKREETIITTDFKEIKLPKDSKALHVVQRIRDEAHRFAITYHRKLRSKNFV